MSLYYRSIKIWLCKRSGIIFFQNTKVASFLFLPKVLILSEIKVNKLPPFSDTQRTVLAISKAPPKTSKRAWWWRRWITNRHQQSFIYFKSFKCLLALVYKNDEWGCARRCVVKNYTSHSGTRHLNWNVKVWQHHIPYPFNNSIVTQLCQGTCYLPADGASKQGPDSVPGGKN